VADAIVGRWRYVLLCTSDKQRNAFPIWLSTDLVHWVRHGYVFPRGRQPRWAVPADGPRSSGRYWAPTIYRLQGRWVVYFSARYNRASGAIPGGGSIAPRTMVIGVATASSLGGPWSTRILHYRGELNAAGTDQELHGGSIDPSLVRDPYNGALYLFWADQPAQIWFGRLRGDGLSIDGPAHFAFGISESFECDPDPNNRVCTIEGPKPVFAYGALYVMYSAADTWDGTYAVGVAASPGFGSGAPFVKLSGPVLRSGYGFIGPGRISQPITGPDHNSYVLFHALIAPTPEHVSEQRILLLGRLNWESGWPVVNDGLP
jgi:arabinan endo-1,5-alpha-L-arabinosidase